MTQNDIDYYKARNERRDMRLKRKETKRHNLAQEGSQRLSAEASYLGAQASQISAGAAQEQAKTRQKEFELQWETEYGMPYGNDPTDTSNYIQVTDVVTGEQYYATKFPEPMTYSEKKTSALEKLHKAAYEKASRHKQVMETAYGGVRIVREGIGMVNDALNLGSKIKTMSGSTNSATGTDLVIYSD